MKLISTKYFLLMMMCVFGAQHAHAEQPSWVQTLVVAEVASEAFAGMIAGKVLAEKACPGLASAALPPAFNVANALVGTGIGVACEQYFLRLVRGQQEPLVSSTTLFFAGLLGAILGDRINEGRWQLLEDVATLLGISKEQRAQKRTKKIDDEHSDFFADFADGGEDGDDSNGDEGGGHHCSGGCCNHAD